MTLLRIIGSNQQRDWLEMAPAEAAALKQARVLIEAGRFVEADRLLKPLVDLQNAEAEFLAASFSLAQESEDEFEQRHLHLLKRSAKHGYPPAQYSLGYHYDTGDLVDEDKPRAARLFMRAASAGHAHSQWIHGLDLLYGRNGLPKDEAAGLRYVCASADAKFQGALETLARFHDKGEFGYPIDPVKAQELRQAALEPSALTY